MQKLDKTLILDLLICIMNAALGRKICMDQPEIRFHTPTPAEATFPYHVVAAGRTLVRPADPAVRRRYNQHVLILTESGVGRVEQQGRHWQAMPGTLVWLDTGRDYAHGCDPAAARWHYLWLGMQGFGLEALHARCMAEGGQILRPADPALPATLMTGILAHLKEHAMVQAARTSSAVAALLALMLDSRAGPTTDSVAPRRRIAPMLDRLRLSLAQPWTVPALARAADLSVAQLHRQFLAETGLPPMGWLRRERVTAAKPLLLDPTRQIQNVAETVGYADPFHFSRDFHRLTGRSPREFRKAGGT
jgi:AraC family transcriptional regulator of arabinose operon